MPSDTGHTAPQEHPADNPRHIYQILFHFNSAEIEPEFQGMLNEVGDRLKASPQLRASIKGYTDVRGNPEYNLDLSVRRAKAVANYLIKREIDASRLRTQGKGMYTDTNGQPSHSNRRVEITITSATD